jgi:hypothetical protein
VLLTLPLQVFSQHRLPAALEPSGNGKIFLLIFSFLLSIEKIKEEGNKIMFFAVVGLGYTLSHVSLNI